MVSYAMTATRAAFRGDMINITVDVDGTPVKARAVLAMVANAGSILGGRFSIGPDVKPDDGELDLCIYLPQHPREVFAVVWKLLRRDFRPDPLMQFVRGRTFRLESESPVPVQADGDIVGETPIEITVAPKAVEFPGASSQFEAHYGELVTWSEVGCRMSDVGQLRVMDTNLLVIRSGSLSDI
jgi:diacylglycerol kinase family enzyme